MQAKWLPTLRLLVTKINETFGHNFKEMAVAGEVALGKSSSLCLVDLYKQGGWYNGDPFNI